MLSARSLTRVVASEAMETFLPDNEASLGLLVFRGGLNGVGVGEVKGAGGLLVVSRSKGFVSEADSRLRPGMTRPVVSCDWSRSLM